VTKGVNCGAGAFHGNFCQTSHNGQSHENNPGIVLDHPEHPFQFTTNTSVLQTFAGTKKRASRFPRQSHEHTSKNITLTTPSRAHIYHPEASAEGNCLRALERMWQGNQLIHPPPTTTVGVREPSSRFSRTTRCRQADYLHRSRTGCRRASRKSSVSARDLIRSSAKTFQPNHDRIQLRLSRTAIGGADASSAWDCAGHFISAEDQASPKWDKSGRLLGTPHSLSQANVCPDWPVPESSTQHDESNYDKVGDIL